MRKFLLKLFGIRCDCTLLSNKIISIYEVKKKELLLLYRTESNKEDVLKLVTEINVLAGIIEESKIVPDLIHDTLRIYPSKVK
jgi:hypothetical protein